MHKRLKRIPPKEDTIVGPTHLDIAMSFFIHRFCPELQMYMFQSTQRGIPQEEKEIILGFMKRHESIASSLGDAWWWSYITLNYHTTHGRIRNISKIFEKWCSVLGDGHRESTIRSATSDRMTHAVNQLAHVFRKNNFIVSRGIDLKLVDSDIKYYEALRSVGMTAISQTVSGILAELFNHGETQKRIPHHVKTRRGK
jgi:hypothetical protein